MKVWLEKCIIGLYILVILIIIYGSLFFIRNLFTGSEPSAETLEAERIKWVADCELSPSCQNNEAMDESYKSAHPIKSKTGVSFFKGSECPDDCSEHVAGYNWAEVRGISKKAGCNGYNVSFQEGCLLYVSHRAYEMSDPDYEDSNSDDNACDPLYGC